MQSPEIYTLTISKDIWNSTEERPEISKSEINFGKITYTTVNIGGSDGWNAPIIRLQLLDDLCAAINSFVAQSDNASKPLQSLYESTINLVEGPRTLNRSMHYITFHAAAMVVNLSDQKSTAKGRTLTFRETLNSNIVLPLVFSEIVLQSVGDRLVGACYEFNSSMRGNIGSRHALRLSSAESSEVPDAQSTPVVELSSQSVQDLLQLQGFADGKISSQAQTFIHNAMLYHMDSDTRDQILKLPRPEVSEALPEFDALDARLKTWLHDVYGPAFVSNAIARADPDRKEVWQQKMSDEERLRIRYWFSGRGETCLSHDRDYSALSELASQRATPAVMPALSDYTSESQYWATKIDAIMRDAICQRSLRRTPLSKGVNYSNKLMSLARFLDVESMFTHSQLDIALAGSMKEALRSQFLISSPEDVAQANSSICDILRELLTTTLQPAIGDTLTLDDAFRKQLREDITSLENENNLDPGKPLEQRIEAIVQFLNGSKMIDELILGISPLGQTSENGEEGGEGGDEEGHGLEAADSAYATTVQLFDVVYPRVYQKVWGLTPKAVGAKGILTAGFLAFFIANAAKCFAHFDDTSAVERAQLSSSALAAAVNIIHGSLEAFLLLRKSQLASALGPVAAAEAQRAAEELQARTSLEMTDFSQNLRQAVSDLDEDNPLSLSERVSQKVQPTVVEEKLPFNPTTEVEMDEFVPNRAIVAATRDLEPGLAAASKSFAIAENVLKVAGSALGIALVITTSCSLADQWDSISDTKRALNVASLAASGVAVGVDVVFTTIEVLDIQISATAASTIPIAGLVFAAIGAVLLIALAIIGSTEDEGSAPLPDPVSEFIDNTLHPLVKSWNPQSKAQMDVTVDESSIPSEGVSGIFEMKVSNNDANARLQMDFVIITFKTGARAASLFSDTNFIAVEASDREAENPGHIFVDQFSDDNPLRVVCERSLIGTSKNKQSTDSKDAKPTYLYKLTVAGKPSPSNPRGILDFGPRGGFRLNVTGTGRGKEPSELEIIEESHGDSVFHMITLRENA